MKIQVSGHLVPYAAFGQVTIRFAEHLDAEFIRPYLMEEKFGAIILKKIKERITFIDRPKCCDRQLAVLSIAGIDKFKSKFPVGRRILYTLWESSLVPKHYVKFINENFNSIITSSRYCIKVFRDSGIRLPISHVALGVDTDTFNPKSFPSSTGITFGCAGRLAHGGVRKGINKVVEIFQRAFPTEANVKLHVKIFPDCPVPPCFDNRITFTREYLSPEALAVWYNGLNGFITVSTEGVGLHQREAVACGVPLIGACYAGVSEAWNGLKVKYREIQNPDKKIYKGVGKIAEVDEKDMIRKLRLVAKNPVKFYRNESTKSVEVTTIEEEKIQLRAELWKQLTQ